MCIKWSLFICKNGMHLHHRYTYILSIQNQMNVYSIRYQQYKVKKFSSWLGFSFLSSVRPVSPSTSYTTVKPVTISGVGVVNLVVDSDRSVPLCGDVPGTQYIPSVIPISPSSVSYKSLLDNMPLSLLAKKGGSKKKDSDDASEDDQERVERRISVRQSECAYR